jgi:hypothetical protein
MFQEPQFTSFPRPRPVTRAILEEWGFTILELESDPSEVVQVILPVGWRKKGEPLHEPPLLYPHKFILVDNQGHERGEGIFFACGSYFRVNPKYIPESPSKPSLYEQCLSFFKKRSPDA